MADRNLQLAILIKTSVTQALADFEKLRGSAKRTREELSKPGGQVRSDGIERANARTRELARSNLAAAGSYSFLISAAKGFISLYTAKRILETADSYRVLQQRIRSATADTGDYNQVSAEISRISKTNRVELENTVSTFQRLAISGEALGATNQQMLRLTDLVQKLGKIGGSTQAALTAGQLQFAQALSSDVVRAEEINSIIENIPLLAKKIEQGLGLLPGHLKQAVNEGKVLSKDVLEVILKQGTEIDAEFARISPSISDSITNMRTSAAEFIGKLDQATGITQGIAEGLQAANKAIDSGNAEHFLTVIKQIGIAVGAIGLARLFGGATTAALTFFAALQNVNGALLLANARTTLLAGSAGALRGVMALLGGPGGLIILAASALAYFAIKAAGARAETDRLGGSLDKLAGASDKAIAAKYTEKLQQILLISQEIDELESKRREGGYLTGIGEARLRRLRDDETRLKTELRALEQTIKARKEKAASLTATEEKPAPGASAAVIDLTRASVEAQSRILKAGLDAQLADLDRAQAQNLISYRDYYAQRAAIQTQAIDAEIRRQQAALTEAKKDAAAGGNEQSVQAAKEKQIGIEAELTILRQQRARVAITSAADEAQAEQQLATELEQVRIRLLEAQGKSAEARTLAIQHEFEGLSKRLEIEGDAAGQAIVSKLINVEAARVQLDALQQQVDQAVSRLSNTEQGIQAQQIAGALTELQARQQIVAAHKEAAAVIEDTIPKAETLAAAIGSEEALAGVDRMKTALQEVSTVVDGMAPLWNSIGQDFGAALDSMLTTTDDWRTVMADLFQQLSNSFLQFLVIEPFQEWVAMQARMLALKIGFNQSEQAADAASSAETIATKTAETTAVVTMDAAQAGAGAASSQASIPYVGPALALAAMAAMVAAVLGLLGGIKKFSVGGEVPGSGSGDRVPSMLEPGEFVVRKAAVRNVGVQFLNHLNGVVSPPRLNAGRLGFAAGGVVPAPITVPHAPVQQAAASGGAPQSVRMVLLDDRSNIGDYLASSDGEKVLVQTLRRNSMTIKQILG